MPRIRVIPPRPGSASAQALSESLPNSRRLRLEGSSFSPSRPDDIIVNWGRTSSDFQEWSRRIGTRFLNPPNAVKAASNKLTCFRALSEHNVSVPPWTDSQTEAQKWSSEDLYQVCSRSILNGSGGAGLDVHDRGVDIPAAPLYTKYVPKESEWRIHVFRGRIIDIQRKIRNPDDNRPANEVDWQVRNHANGFVYIRGSSVPAHQSVRDEAIAAVTALGLDFGAVDVIWNARNTKAYVLEINTAPGLEGQTIETYSNAIREEFNL